MSHSRICRDYFAATVSGQGAKGAYGPIGNKDLLLTCVPIKSLASPLRFGT
jgi:hypothetical protein